MRRASVGPLHLWQDPEEPPYLDDDYAQAVHRMRQQREFLFDTIRSWLADHEEDWIRAKFFPNGRAQDEDVMRQQTVWKDEAKRLHEAKHLWYQAGLGRPDLLADFSYWSKMSSFDIPELTLLSMGLEPVEGFRERFDRDKMRREKTAPADQIALKRHEMFRRQFTHGSRNTSVSPTDLVRWVREVELDAHPAFLRMIDTLEARLAAKNQTRYNSPGAERGAGEKPPEGRVLASLTKLIIAMAVDAYGYVPNDKRSTTPKEIEGATDRLGVSVSQDTIRKYLRMGAAHLSEEDKSG